MDQQQANISPTIDGILAHNRAFVERREFERYATDKYPDKKLAIVSCMDTRLTALLLAALLTYGFERPVSRRLLEKTGKKQKRA